MEEILLEGTYRDVIGKQVRALRRAGKLPAIIYGRNITPIPILLDLHTASRILPGLPSSQLVVVEVDGKRHTALVRERQRHPVTGILMHVDFLEVSMTEKLRAMVSIVLTGQAPAVKNLNGVLVTPQEELEVECLPADLPSQITVDISKLNDIGDAIYVRDLEAIPGVEILTPSEEVLVVVTPPLREAEVEGVVEAAFEPEVIEHGKKEEEEF